MGGRVMPLVMSAGTVVLGLYLALIGGTEYAFFGWLLFVLGLLGLSARMVLGGAGHDRPQPEPGVRRRTGR
ncbi:MAG: hypothetical protein JWR81_6556 [Pseudonocardia sp.]|jgi:hypothetical protein|nr:hypothetical protein [Pseudonocardia sp.]MDT7618673.1 hypothetical protein [Pseudonocardiales bacterium]